MVSLDRLHFGQDEKGVLNRFCLVRIRVWNSNLTGAGKGWSGRPKKGWIALICSRNKDESSVGAVNLCY